MEARSLSRAEAKIILSLEAQGRELITLDEITGAAGASRGYGRKLAFGLVRKGWLERTRRGVYLLNPSRHGPDAIPDTDPFRVGSLLADPYYFGFATAAEVHGVFPQAGRVYYIVSPVRIGTRRFGTSRFRGVLLPRARFFGTETRERRGRTIVVSDLERTILDVVNRPSLAGGMSGVGQILSLSKPRIDWSRLAEYLERYGNRSLTRRLGYLADRVRPSLRPPGSWARATRASPTEPFVPLGPPSRYGRRGPHDERWRIIANVADAELFAEGRIP